MLYNLSDIYITENELNMLNNLNSAFSSHNCNAAFSSFGSDFRFSYDRLPRKCRLRVRGWIFFDFRLGFESWWSLNPLIYFLQSDISLSTTGFNEVKWICHRSCQLCRHLQHRLPSYKCDLSPNSGEKTHTTYISMLHVLCST